MTTEIARVTFEVVLDLDKLEENSLEWWAKELRMEFRDAAKPTWTEVYVELSRAIVGSDRYKKYCITAIDDNSRFRQLAQSVGNTSKRIPEVRGEVFATVTPLPPPRPPAKPTKKTPTRG